MKRGRLAFGRRTPPLASPAAPGGPRPSEPGRIYHRRNRARSRPYASRRIPPSGDTHAEEYRGVSSTSRYLAPASGGGAAPVPRHFRVCPAWCSKQTNPPPPPLDSAAGPEFSGWRSHSVRLLEGDRWRSASLRLHSDPASGSH